MFDRETHLLDLYLVPLINTFEGEAAKLRSRDGLQNLFDKEEFMARVVRPFAGAVLERLAGGVSDAVVIEKTPANIRHHQLITQLSSDFLLVDVVRDPRAVVASWKAAGAESWGNWARKAVSDVASTWVNYRLSGMQASKLMGLRYRMVKYEDLHQNPLPVLANLFSWMGLTASVSEIEQWYTGLEISCLREGALSDAGLEAYTEDRINFFRSGKCDSWLKELTSEEISTIEVICGGAMGSLGYPVGLSPIVSSTGQRA